MQNEQMGLGLSRDTYAGLSESELKGRFLECMKPRSLRSLAALAEIIRALVSRGARRQTLLRWAVESGCNKSYVRSLLSRIFVRLGLRVRRKGAGRKFSPEILELLADLRSRFGARYVQAARALCRAAESEAETQGLEIRPRRAESRRLLQPEISPFTRSVLKQHDHPIMNTKLIFLALLGGTLTVAAQQNTASYSLVEQGYHYNIWQSATNPVGPNGHPLPGLRRFTELATGLNHVGAGGSWVPSSSQITATPTGAQLTNAQYKVAFAGDINTAGALDVVMPDSNHLTANILGLNYFDTSSGMSFLFAETTNCNGVLPSAGNEALYESAFSGIQADVEYECTISGLEQFIILRQQPPSPAKWNLNPATTLLEIWTEFIHAPTPMVTPVQLPEGQDQYLAFGLMHMGKGEALAIGSETNKVRTTKQWVVSDGRTVLVEQVPLEALQPLLQALPPPSGESASLRPLPGSIRGQVAKRRLLPRPKLARVTAPRMKLASSPHKEKGVAIDFSVQLSSSQTNYTFKMDTTYFISGNVNLSGSNVFEGGTVLKFATNTSIVLEPSGTTPTAAFLGGMYRPITFTAKDDNSIGDPVTNSTGAPAGHYYANPALSLEGVGTVVMAGVRFDYASQAIYVANGEADVSDAQFVDCQQAFSGGEAAVHVRNGLFANTLTNFNLSSCTTSAENATFSSNSYLATVSSGSSTLALTNCILAKVTNLTNITTGGYGVTLSGDYNGFYNTTTFGSDVAPNLSASPFQTVGAGQFYLATDCPWRNAGTTNVSTNLLAILTQRTTYPPVVYSNLTISVPTTFGPQAQRDTDTPDLGFHYFPLDYCLAAVTATNALTIAPGTAIGMFGGGSVQGGLNLEHAGQLLSQGLATAHNWIVEYNTVQEQPGSAWAVPNWQAGYFAMVQDPSGGNPFISCRFTDWSVPAQDIFHTYLSYAALNIQDCQVQGGIFANFSTNVMNVTNCLFERSWTYVQPGGSTGQSGLADAPLFRNNLFFGGIFEIDPTYQTNALAKDNLFDRTTITNDAPGWAYAGGHNAFVTNYSRLQPTYSSDIVLTNPIAYQIGPLGNYYQPTNSPLINVGSTNANLVGLYHYTVSTNLVSGAEVPEADNIVSIGVHFVAVDQYGNPLNSGNGPDYLLDANGNGLVDSGEIAWNITGDVGLKVWITEPKNNATIP